MKRHLNRIVCGGQDAKREHVRRGGQDAVSLRQPYKNGPGFSVVSYMEVEGLSESGWSRIWDGTRKGKTEHYIK